MAVERREGCLSCDKGLENESNTKEWEDARCPVCIEHPHNAILLICSSHENGCRPFMCDTSYRHSNCFDQFQKSFTTQTNVSPTQGSSTSTDFSSLETNGSTSLNNQTKIKSMMCPLCRGQINGWVVVESARLLMNEKARSCASEGCEFVGTYSDMRTHARTVHPCVRPTEADPERQRNWRRLERRRDLGDLLSSLRTSIGGVEIETEGEVEEEENEGEESNLPPLEEGNTWLTVVFVVRILRSRTRRTRTRDDEDDNEENEENENQSSEENDETQPRRRRLRRRTTPENENSSV